MDREKCLKRGKFYYLCAKTVLLDLNKRNIPYAIIKGEPLSMLAYNSFGERLYGDIDLLISRKNIKSAEECLCRNHFFQSDKEGKPLSRRDRILCFSNSHQIPSYKLQVDKYFIELDLNFDIFWGEYTGERIDVDDFLSDTISMNIFGYNIWTLPPLKAMVQLILHNYKDMNSIYILLTRRSIRFSMFQDIYYLLINNQSEITIKNLYDISEQYGIVPYVFYMLYYTGQVFEDSIVKKYVEAFKTPAGESLLDCYGLCEAERKQWKCDFKTRIKAEDITVFMEEDANDKYRTKVTINKKFF